MHLEMIGFSLVVFALTFIFPGKRPRDLLNPKAVKYMQLVFSMKDTISKRETREISAQFGVTVTQVLISSPLYCLIFAIGFVYCEMVAVVIYERTHLSEDL